jgi:DNA-binding GntR family transcriptional regulator
VSQPGRAPDSLAEMHRLAAALKSGNPDEAQAVCIEHIDRAAAVGLAVLQRRQTSAD